MNNFPDTLTLCSKNTLRTYRDILNFIDADIYEGILYYVQQTQMFIKIEDGEIHTYTPIEDNSITEGWSIVESKILTDGQVEYIGKVEFFETKKTAFEYLQNITVEHQNRLKELEDYDPIEYVFPRITEDKDIQTEKQYVDVQYSEQYQPSRSSTIPPRTTFMEPPILGSSRGDPTLCTYTEVMINDGQAHYAYSDTNEHIIRVSNTISKISIRGNDAGTEDTQIIEYNSGNGVTEIGPSCFMNCKALEKITLQNNIKTIEEKSFKNCQNLSNINFDGKIFEYIGDNAFENIGIHNLSIEYYIDDMYKTGGVEMFSNNNKLETIDISTNFIPSNMFQGSNIKNATINIMQQCTDYDTLSDNVIISSEPRYFNINISEGTFTNCDFLSSVTINTDSQIDLKPFLKNATSLKELNVSSNSILFLDNCTFEDNNSLSSMHFMSCFVQESFSEECFKSSSLEKIQFDTIPYDALLNNNYIQYTQTEDIIKDIASKENLPYFFYERFYHGSMKGKQLYYGCIYDDYDSVVKFSVENKIPVVFLIQEVAPLDIKSTTQLHFCSDIDSIRYMSTICNKNYSWQTILRKKKFYEWIFQQPYIFCFLISNKDLQNNYNKYAYQYRNWGYWTYASESMTHYPQGWQVFGGTALYLSGGYYQSKSQSKGEVYRTDLDKKFTTENNFFVSTEDETSKKRVVGEGITPPRMKNIYYLSSDSFQITRGSDYCRLYNNNMGSTFLPILFSPTGKWISYDKNLNQYGYLAHADVQHIVKYSKEEVEKFYGIDMSTREGSQKAEQIRKNNNSSSIYLSYYKDMGYSVPFQIVNGYSVTNYKATSNENEQVLNLNIRAIQEMIKTFTKNYQRDSKFNHPEYKPQNIDLSYKPVKYTKQFNCWGIEHDCEIWTSDHIKCKWDYKNQKLTKTGTW